LKPAFELVFFRLNIAMHEAAAFVKSGDQQLRSTAVFNSFLARVLKYFQTNLFNRMPMTFQVSLQSWQHLSQFGGCGVGVDQQAPF
jgi:hypothetical protein